MGMLFDSAGTRALKQILHRQFNQANIGNTASRYLADFQSAKSLAQISEDMSIPDNSLPAYQSPLKVRWQAFLAAYVTGQQAETDIKNKIVECLTRPYKPIIFHA